MRKKILDDANEKVKVNNNAYNRGILDDMRLSLESLLRSVLNNDFPLEKQVPGCIGNYLKKKGNSKEIRNMCEKLIDIYSKYQNNNVKHQCVDLDKNEVRFVVDLTLALMTFLAK